MTGLRERNSLLKPRIQRHRRIKYALDIEVRGDVIAEFTRTHDISAGGLFVDSTQAYTPGMTVRLRFRIEEHSFETRARVVHVRPQMGFGAQFLDLTADQKNEILRFVHRERATREAERLMRQDAWARMR